jgi:hypothetical protein
LSLPLQNDARDTFKEVLGWYGLQETPPLREEAVSPPSSSVGINGTKVKLESPSDDHHAPLDLTGGSASPTTPDASATPTGTLIYRLQ